MCYFNSNLLLVSIRRYSILQYGLFILGIDNASLQSYLLMRLWKETPFLLYKVNTDPGQNQNFHSDMFIHILFEPLKKEGATEQ